MTNWRNLRALCPEARTHSEMAVKYVFLPGLRLPDGCSPATDDCLLCLGPRDGYENRPFFSQVVSSPAQRNWNSHNIRIFERNWFAFSWRVPNGRPIENPDQSPERPSSMIRIKMRERQRQCILEDLRRPHPFAFERIGYLCCRQVANFSALCCLRFDMSRSRTSITLQTTTSVQGLTLTRLFRSTACLVREIERSSCTSA